MVHPSNGVHIMKAVDISAKTEALEAKKKEEIMEIIAEALDANNLFGFFIFDENSPDVKVLSNMHSPAELFWAIETVKAGMIYEGSQETAH